MPPYIDRPAPTNDPGTDDEGLPITAPVTTGAGADTGGGAAAAGPKAFDSAKPLADLQLDPKDWTVIGTPCCQSRQYGAPPSTRA